jgi:hypothetical protein
MCWTICFLWTQHGCTSADTLTVKTVEYRVLKIHMHCMKILCIHQRLAFAGQCLENKLRDHCSLKRQLLWEIIQIFWLNSLLCWKRMNRTAGFSKMGSLPLLQTDRQTDTQTNKQKLSSRTSVVVTLSGTDFGHHNPQTLYHPTSFFGYFLRVYRNNPRRLENLKHNTERAVAVTSQKTLWKVAKTLWIGSMLVFKKVGDIFNICHNYAVYHTLSIFEKIKIK